MIGSNTSHGLILLLPQGGFVPLKELDKRPLIESVVGLSWAGGELAGSLRITESLAVEFLDSVWRLRVLEQHLRLIETQTVYGAGIG